MGNKQGRELSPEEKQRLKDEKRLLKEDKERKKRLRKVEQRRIKEERKRSSTGGTPAAAKKDKEEDAESVGGSSVWSEKSVGSAPESWYHSASEPGSKRSSIYLPASAGPGYYQHDCWYSGYEDSGSDKSKPNSRAGSRPGSRPPSRSPSVKDTLNLRSSSLERYPLGVPIGEAIEPIHKAGSLDLTNVAAAKFLEDREKLTADLEIAAAIASRYDETIRSSREQLERTTVDKASLIDRASLLDRASLTDKVSLTSSVYHSAEEAGSIRGEKRKVILEDRTSLSSVYYSADEASIGSKRRPLDYGSDHTSATGSLYYSADEGGSVAGSVYYSATSGSEVEDHVDDADILGKDRPSVPSKPVAVDREGSILSRLAYIKVENDALLLHWEVPDTDGGTPISGYILERCEGDGDMWVRVNLVPIKDIEYAVANLIGGRNYRFRVSAENAVGMSDPSEPSEVVSISTDQEATEPHFLKELRDVTAVEGHRVEFIVDIIGTPPPDIAWYKDGYEIFDTKRYEFIADGDRYSLVLREARITDAGDIRVRATNRVGVASSQAVLHIQAPPHINLPHQYDQGLIFDTDELIRLRVPYTGRPQPQATWAHNGKQIEADDKHTIDVSEKYVTLKIAGASRNDKGMYALNLTNPQGIDNVSFFVTVTDRPDHPSMPVVTDITGQSVTLRWEPPQDDGGCRISNYIVEYFRIGWDVWLKGASSRITWTQLNELIIGSEYRFRVKAENAYGVSDAGEECEPILIDESKSPSGYAKAAACDREGNSLGIHDTKSYQECVNQSIMGMHGNQTGVSQDTQRTNSSKKVVSLGGQGMKSSWHGVNQKNQAMVGNQAVSTFGQSSGSSSTLVQCYGKPMDSRVSPMVAFGSDGLTGNQGVTVTGNVLPGNTIGKETAAQSGMVTGMASFKRSCEERQLTAGEEQRQKILKTIADQTSYALRSDDSGTEVGSSPESSSEYSSDNAETTVRYVGTDSYGGKFAISSMMPKTPGNPNPSCHLGFVSNGCSKVKFLGSVIGVETDDEGSVSSCTSSPSENPFSPVNCNVEDTSRKIFPSAISSQGLAANQTSDMYFKSSQSSSTQVAPINQTKEEISSESRSFQDYAVAASGSHPSSCPNTSALYQASLNILARTSFSSRPGDPDQSDMNLYFDQMKDKIEIPADFYSCQANPMVNVADSDPHSNEDTSLQEDSDTDTIVYSPSKLTEGTQPALCESHNTAHVTEGETGEGLTSIPFDTSGSKSWSTPASCTIATPSGVTDRTQPALRETCSTLQGPGGDTGEGITSIPLDTSESSKSKSRNTPASPSGQPWMARVAIAHKFRIICGGLASMTHLGNINALQSSDDDSDETESQELSRPREGSMCRMRTLSNDETIDEEIGSIQSEEVAANDAEFFKDDDETHGSVLPYQQMLQSLPTSPYNFSESSPLDYPLFNNQTFLSQNAMCLSPQSGMETSFQVTSPPSLNEVTVYYQPTLTSSTIPIIQSNKQQLQMSRTSTDIEGRIVRAKDVSHSSMSLKSAPLSPDSQKSDYPLTTESSQSTDESSGDKLASWEPKINRAITSRLSLLEDLVYRCLENEDAALNEVEVTEEEGASAPPTSLSRIGSSSRVDVRKDELRNLIGDLEGIVSGMKACTRTLSADNVAKFFEKTASVVGDPGSSSSSSRHSKDEATIIEDIIKSSRSPRSLSMAEVDKVLSEGEEGSSSGRESISDVFQPGDQIHIKPAILKRIDHLDKVMNRCLENEDITMNTLGSSVISPTSSQREEQPQKQHHSSKVELKDLIGDLGSLVSGLGDRFNPDKI